MARKPKIRYRIVFQQGRSLTKTVVLAAVVLSMAALLALRGAVMSTQSQVEALRTQAAALEQQKAHLEEKVSMLGTVDGVILIAQEELGLADPNTVIIEPEE